MPWMLKIAVVLLLTLHVSEAKTFKGEVESYGSVGCQNLSQKESPYVSSICVDKVKIKYKIYSLMGEPVEVYAVYWELSPYINLRSGSRPISSMPDNVQKAYKDISLHYKSRFIINLSHRLFYRASFRTSGGALKKSGRGYSFDTPGSPSWNKFMLKSTSGDTYHSRKEAIGIFKSIPPHEASFSFEKIENLAFSNLYALNSALKPKKEKKKKESKPQTAKDKQDTKRKQDQKLQTNNTGKTDPVISSKMMKGFNTQSSLSQTTPGTQSGQDNSSGISASSTPVPSNYMAGPVSASLLLLIDVSGSMQGGKLKSAKKAALETIETSLQKGVEISILAFSGGCGSPISKRINFTRDRGRLVNFVKSLSANGGTPLGNALKVANNYLYNSRSSTSQTQMIILLADGDDNCGNIKSVMNSLRNKGIIFRHQTVGLEVNANSKAANQLRSIAKSSGGVYHHAKDHKQLPSIFKEALSAMEILDMIGMFGTVTPEKAPPKPQRSSMQGILDQF